MGLLGDGWDDPQSMASLSLAAGLLGPGGFGTGLSRGLQGYQSALTSAADLNAKKQGLAMAQLQFQAALRNQNLINDALSRWMGGGQSEQDGAPDRVSQALSAGAQAGSVGPTVDNAARLGAMPEQAPTARQRSPFDAIPGDAGMLDLAFNGGKNLPNLVMESMKPVSLRGGGYFSLPGKAPQQLPPAQDGFIAQPDGNGGWKYVQVEGGPEAVAKSAAAKASGPAGYKTIEVIGDDGQKRTYYQKDVLGDYSSPSAPPTNTAPPAVNAPTTLMGVSGVKIKNPTQADIDATRAILPELQNDVLNATDPQERAIAQARLDTANARLKGGAAAPAQASMRGGVVTGFAPGVEHAAKNGQDAMQQSYQGLRAANQSAQTVQARLDGIAANARAAITGGDTQWRDFANNLLQVAGISERATDRKTAGDLIDKYNAQLALAIGAGAQGTDALRAMGAAANPNRHMTPEAMDEVVQQLRGAAQAQQTKAQLLTPLYNAGDYKNYNNVEQVFDKNADYRLWQIREATRGMNAQQAAVYLQSHYTPAQLSSFKVQRDALSNIGVNP